MYLCVYCFLSSSNGLNPRALPTHFSHLSFVIGFFPHKTKTGTANSLETTNKYPPGPIKVSSQSTLG